MTFLAEKYFASLAVWTSFMRTYRSKDVRCQRIQKNVLGSKKDLKIYLAVLSLKKKQI